MPESREEASLRYRQYYQKNRERLSKKNSLYYQKNQDRITAKARQDRKERPEHYRKIMLRYRERGKPQNHTVYREAVTVELLTRDGFDCGICRTSLSGKIHIDHIVTIKDGGSNLLSNFRLAHDKCNYARNRLYVA